MSKGSGNTRSSSSASPNGLPRDSFGDSYVTNFNRVYLFNNPEINDAVQKKYPDVSFGSDGDSLTIGHVNLSKAHKIINFIQEEREKMVENEVKSIRKATFTQEINGQWNLSTRKGDTSIVVTNDPFLGKVYEVSIIGSYDSWGHYDTVTPKVNKFSTLNKAKETAKAYLEDYYIKRNKYDKVMKFE